MENPELDKRETIEEQEIKQPATVEKESHELQKAVWIRDEIGRRREEEDKLLEQIFAEQQILHELDSDMDQNMKHAVEGRRYRKDMKERLDRRIYEMHDLSEDKLEGMREYGYAYYRGFALAMFFLSTALGVFCGYLHGVTDQITLAMLFFTAVQAAVLIHEKKCFALWRIICRLAGALLFPGMLVLFIGYELHYSYYERGLTYGLGAGLIVLVLTTAVYFLYDPYRAAKLRISDAKAVIRSVEKTARKQVKKNKKTRMKVENKAEKLRIKEENKAERLRGKEEKRMEKLREKEEKRMATLQKKEEKRTERKLAMLAFWEEKKDMLSQKFLHNTDEVAEEELITPEEIPKTESEEAASQDKEN